MKKIIYVMTILLFFDAYAQNVKRSSAVKKNMVRKNVAARTLPQTTKKRAPASDPDAPIEVRGQSRNLNMMLILQNQDEIIDFIKLRKDYQDETKKMNY